MARRRKVRVVLKAREGADPASILRAIEDVVRPEQIEIELSPDFPDEQLETAVHEKVVEAVENPEKVPELPKSAEPEEAPEDAKPKKTWIGKLWSFTRGMGEAGFKVVVQVLVRDAMTK